jgi:hypothetical protein
MADYDVNALSGTVLGIAGTGIALGTLGRMTNMVFENIPQNKKRQGKKYKRQPVQTYNRFAFSSPPRFHL